MTPKFEHVIAGWVVIFRQSCLIFIFNVVFLIFSLNHWKIGQQQRKGKDHFFGPYHRSDPRAVKRTHLLVQLMTVLEDCTTVTQN